MKRTFTLFNRNWFDTPPGDTVRSLNIVRIAVAIILAVHGIHGIINPSVLTGFGQYLGSVGFPFGVALAWIIMFVQLGSSIAMVLNRFVAVACICHMIVLCFGIALIHVGAGWFVVGPGHDGVEYSLLLIACLFAVSWANWPQKQITTKEVMVNN